MHYFIYPTKDAWISSGSNKATTGISERDQNYGQDEILELKKNFWNKSFDYQTRVLLQFDLTSISQSLINKEITNPKYYLRLYEAEGNKDLSTSYTLSTHPISQSWDEGTGKFGDNPKVTNGVSWDNRNYFPGNSAVTWSQVRNPSSQSYGGSFYTGSGYESSQSFSYESPDVNMDITTVVENWLGAPRITNKITNNGLLLKFSGSAETDKKTFGQLKFFSKNTNTIYPPKLEIRWDDHIFNSSSKWNKSSQTGSLLPLSMSGHVDNYLYMVGLRDKYRETEKIKFRVRGRERYVQKTFSRSVQTITGSFIQEGSGSYSIVDIATNEVIIPFSAYTSMSCDETSNYFIQWMNGFQTDRIYKILYKLNYNDGQEQIFDNNFEFKVVR